MQSGTTLAAGGEAAVHITPDRWQADAPSNTCSARRPASRLLIPFRLPLPTLSSHNYSLWWQCTSIQDSQHHHRAGPTNATLQLSTPPTEKRLVLFRCCTRLRNQQRSVPSTHITASSTETVTQSKNITNRVGKSRGRPPPVRASYNIVNAFSSNIINSSGMRNINIGKFNWKCNIIRGREVIAWVLQWYTR